MTFKITHEKIRLFIDIKIVSFLKLIVLKIQQKHKQLQPPKKNSVQGEMPRSCHLYFIKWYKSENKTLRLEGNEPQKDSHIFCRDYFPIFPFFSAIWLPRFCCLENKCLKMRHKLTWFPTMPFPRGSSSGSESLPSQAVSLDPGYDLAESCGAE